MTTCPRCKAQILPGDMPDHIDWHKGVPDGFHEFRPRTGRDEFRAEGDADQTERCFAEERNSSGGAFWYCNLPAEHWYHQPLTAAGDDGDQ